MVKPLFFIHAEVMPLKVQPLKMGRLNVIRRPPGMRRDESRAP